MNDVITKEKLESLNAQIIWIRYILIKKHNLLIKKHSLVHMDARREAHMKESDIDKTAYAELIDLIIQKKTELPIIDKAFCCCNQIDQLIKDLLLIIETQGNEKAYDYFLNSVDIPRKQQLQSMFEMMNFNKQELINPDLIAYIFED